MDTSLLRGFAVGARVDLLREVGARLDVVLAAGSGARLEFPQLVGVLEGLVDRGGRESIVERVAYTWFNRIVALRFMDVNGFTGVGVVSPKAGLGGGQPEVLENAKAGVFDTSVVGDAVVAAVTALLVGSRPSSDPQGEAYGLLLEAYCHHWNQFMDFMFEAETDYTELLMPVSLLSVDSVRDRAVKVLTADVCKDVEVIGWLYQFYISDRKDEVFAGFKKNKKAGAAEIPAATQLFTPHWIVKYLVENSLGRLWMLNNPSSKLVDRMDYYIAPVDEETDFLKITKPEELTVIDPACGSGHMLTYAFDLLYAIYEEEGYAPSDIPGLILTHNLYGTEIDDRAGSLAAFALSMKARAKQRTFFTKQVEPKICVIKPISFTPNELDFLTTKTGDRLAEEEFWNQFAEADTLGSLIAPDPDLTNELANHLETLDDQGDIFYSGDTLPKAHQIIHQAKYLTNKYTTVVANPPYMGSKQMNSLLSEFVKREYPDGKSDLFAAFIERCAKLACPQGSVGMITMQSWMFLSSFEKLRSSILANQQINSMLHLGTRAFDSIGGEVVSTTAFVLTNIPAETRTSARDRAGTFIRLVDGSSETEKINSLDNALKIRTNAANLYLASSNDFATIPGSPIVYWLSEKMRNSFRAGQPLKTISEPRQGLATADNNRFLRQWWEVSRHRTALSCTARDEAAASGARWFPDNQGGEFRKWYGNQEHLVNWENDGAEINEFKPRSVIRNPGMYFKPSISWSDVSTGDASFRLCSAGFIFDTAGPSAFGDEALLDRMALLLNSRYVSEVMQVLSPTMNFSPGYVGLIPVAHGVTNLSTENVKSLVHASRADWDEAETSWNFAGNPLIAACRRS